MEYYLTIKKQNEVSMYTTTWMDLKIIMLSERSHPKGSTCHTVPFVGNSRKA